MYSCASEGTTDEQIPASILGELHPAQAEHRRELGRELVGGRIADGHETPVLDQGIAAVHADVRLRVADVDREQHAGDYCRQLLPVTRLSR